MTAQSQAINAAGSGGVMIDHACTFRGFAIASVAGADVVIYDNASTGSGLVLAAFTLAAKGFTHVDISDGVRCLNGIFIVTSAAITGHVRVG